MLIAKFTSAARVLHPSLVLIVVLHFVACRLLLMLVSYFYACVYSTIVRHPTPPGSVLSRRKIHVTPPVLPLDDRETIVLLQISWYCFVKIIYSTFDRAAFTATAAVRLLTMQTEHIAADGYGFDYVMVFKAEQEEVVTDFADKAVRQIIAAGLTVRVYFSSSGKEIFCEMRAPVERLMQFADQVSCRSETPSNVTLRTASYFSHGDEASYASTSTCRVPQGCRASKSVRLVPLVLS